MTHFTGLVILLCWATLFVFIAISAFFVKRTIEIARGWKWSWLILLVVVAALLLLEHLRHPSFVLTRIALPSPTPIVGAAADLLTVAGFVIALWGRIVLGRNWNMHPGLKENHELIARGPYAYVRHPMYSGLSLMALGTVIWSGHKSPILALPRVSPWRMDQAAPGGKDFDEALWGNLPQIQIPGEGAHPIYTLEATRSRRCWPETAPPTIVNPLYSSLDRD